MRKNEPQKIKWVFGLKTKLIALALILLFLLFKLQNYERIQLSADQIEMMPSIVPGQVVYLYKHPKLENYLVGDIVYYRKKNESKFHFARLVALNKGTLEIKNKNLYLNQTIHAATKDAFPVSVQKIFQLSHGQFFLVQDQQGASWMDSIALGPIDSSELEIRGKVFFFMKQSP